MCAEVCVGMCVDMCYVCVHVCACVCLAIALGTHVCVCVCVCEGVTCLLSTSRLWLKGFELTIHTLSPMLSAKRRLASNMSFY